jgi:hypothetical protein
LTWTNAWQTERGTPRNSMFRRDYNHRFYKYY